MWHKCCGGACASPPWPCSPVSQQFERRHPQLVQHNAVFGFTMGDTYERLGGWEAVKVRAEIKKTHIIIESKEFLPNFAPDFEKSPLFFCTVCWQGAR